jgi:acyl-CoA synthetase (NDP forming)
MTPRLTIGQILEPSSVAVLGASESRGKFGGRILFNMLRHGYAGRLVPINRGRSEVRGLPAFPDIGAVPEPPQVAIIAVPGTELVDNVRAAAAAGVGCCVVISTGFAEAGEEGAAMQAEIQAIAAGSGMRILGPNCMGLIVPHHRMPLCSSVVLDTDRLPTGEIAMISQSGALMVSVFDRASTDGIGFRHCVSLGNQADLEICDFLEFMVEDPGTRAICLYVEGLRDGARFRRAALAARAAGKPVLMVKTGRTEAGVRSAQSHTASLAGSFAVFQAVCEEAGVVLARDPDDMVRAANILVRNPAPRARRGVGIVSTSGGGAGIACDRVSEVGLEIAALSEDTRAALRELLLPPQADNPIDMGGRRPELTDDITGAAATCLLSDPAVGYGLVVLTSMPFFAERTRQLGEVAQAAGKPMFLALTPGQAADGPREALRALGMPWFDRFEDALRAIELVEAHDRLRATIAPAPARPDGLPDGFPLPAGQATEGEVKQALAAYGIRTAREAIAATPEAAAEVATGIGFPVVLKAVSRQIIHKSDLGAVALRLPDAGAVREAARAMQARLATAAPDAVLDGFSVQEMVSGEAEVVMGARRDPQFGTVVLVGLGGTLVELLQDFALAPAPVAPERVRAMLAGLRLAPLFAGVRGRPPLDVEAVVEAVVRFSWLAADLGERLVDIEVNPLLVGPAGGGATAVDGRATLAG